MNGGMGGGWTFGFLGPIIGLLVMGVIVYVLWTAFTGQSSDSQRRADHHDDPMQVLRERYARGEIDEETFQKRSRTLQER